MAGEVAISTASGTLSSAGAGATAGLGIEAALIAAGLAAGPIGWTGLAIGAAAGAVMGGSFGFLGGKKAKKAKKYLKAAQEVQLERERNATRESFIQQIRQGRVTRASSLAAATTSNISTSSLSTSALSSIGSQAGHNIEYLANDVRLYELYASYMRKAGAAAESYQNRIALLGSINTLLSTSGSLAMKWSSKKPVGEWNGIGDNE